MDRAGMMVRVGSDDQAVAELLVTFGDERAVVRPGHPVVIGRDAGCDLVVDGRLVSRRHAEFHRDGGTFTVRDVGSLNGTYVNRERVEAATLSNGDEVQIGKFRLVYLTAAVRSGVGAKA